ncbi:hypothetical protein [Streptomyces sp. S186]
MFVYNSKQALDVRRLTDHRHAADLHHLTDPPAPARPPPAANEELTPWR